MLNFCEDFLLQFKFGVLSNEMLLQSKLKNFDWYINLIESFDQALPKKVYKNVHHPNLGQENDKNYYSAHGFLISYDILSVIRYVVGFALFFFIVSGVVYLKCRRTRSYPVTWTQEAYQLMKMALN